MFEIRLQCDGCSNSVLIDKAPTPYFTAKEDYMYNYISIDGKTFCSKDCVVKFWGYKV